MRDLTDRYGLGTAMATMERRIRGDRLSACDASALDERMATAMIDRLAHHRHQLMFSGKSYRRQHALIRQDAVSGGAS